MPLFSQNEQKLPWENSPVKRNNMAAEYWNKMNKNGGRNYLFVVGRKYTMQMGWIDHGDGPVVYSCDKHIGQPKSFASKDYESMDTESAMEIVLSAMHDLQALMPTGSIA